MSIFATIITMVTGYFVVLVTLDIVAEHGVGGVLLILTAITIFATFYYIIDKDVGGGTDAK